ncbi:type I restriction endonuclease subunit R [Aquifex pyrophilus]
MITENITHKKISENLEKVGWQKCGGYKEHQLIEDYLLKDILTQKIREINAQEFEAKGLKDDHVKKVIQDAINKLFSLRDPVQLLDYLKDGTIVELNRGNKGNVAVKINFIDYKNPENNTFCFIHEAKFKGSPENVKPDFTLFINGIPVAIIEAKREISESESYTYLEGLTQIERYEKDSPELFKFVQIGAVFADMQVYLPTYPNPDKEKRFQRNLNIWRDDQGNENIIELFLPHTLLDIIRNFTFFSSRGDGTIFKTLPRYMQYKAVNKAFKRIKDYLNEKSDKNKGLVWHWQGSGKTFEIIYLAEKFYREYENRKPVVFIIVDRKELEKQFDEEDIRPLRNARFKEVFKKIESTEELKQELIRIKESEKNHNIDPKAVYLVMAHKFRKKLAQDLEEYFKEALTDMKIQKKEILILRDEAHRTEGGKSILTAVRNYILPEALRFGFTGTPVHKQENSTFQEYAYPQEGEFYLDKYFIQQSIKDGYTIPLTWRVAVSEGVKINLTEEDIEKLIKDYFVNRKLEEEDEIPEVSESEVKEKLPFSDLLKAEDFIKKASLYIAQKIKEDTENFTFKAMIVAQDRASAVKFKRYLDQFMPQYVKEYTPEWSQVVITHTNNDEDIIRKYRKEVEERYGKNIEILNKEWTENFKHSEKLPKILIVNKKLLTGFDAPILKVMYIAQLMKDVLLLQSSARVNRPYPSKKYGLIVDLCGVLIENYKKAIEKYNLYEDEEINRDILKNLFRDSSELWNEFLSKLQKFKELFKEITGIEWNEFVDKVKKGNKKIYHDAINKIITNEKGLLLLYPLVREAIKIYEAIGAFPEKVNYYDTYRELRVLSAGITRKLKPRVEIPGDIKDELLKRIEFSDIKEIGELKFSLEVIEKLRSSGKDYTIVADFLIPLIAYLEDKKDPIHKAIYKRLKELRDKYISRKVNIEEVIKTLEDSVNRLKKYEAQRKNLKPEDIILKNLEFILSNNGIEIKPTKELRESIKVFLEKKPTEQIKSRLKEELIFSVEKGEEKLEKILDSLIEELLIPMRKEIKNE